MLKSSRGENCFRVRTKSIYIVWDRLLLVRRADAPTSKPGGTPNSLVALHDAAFPGTLPVRSVLVSLRQ